MILLYKVKDYIFGYHKNIDNVSSEFEKLKLIIKQNKLPYTHLHGFQDISYLQNFVIKQSKCENLIELKQSSYHCDLYDEFLEKIKACYEYEKQRRNNERISDLEDKLYDMEKHYLR